jgi:hypothetical protein
LRNKIRFFICELNYLFTKICSASAKASEVLLTTPAQALSTTTTTTMTDELSSWSRTKKTTSYDSQYDEQISNTTALPVIAPPAPFPFLRPGNQKASKQVRFRVQPKSKKPNQNFTATSAHAVLWIRTTKTCIASVNIGTSSAAASKSATSFTQPSPPLQATQPDHERLRALLLRLEKAKAKPILVSCLQKKNQKAKSQKQKSRALLGGATERNLPSRPRYRNAKENRARERRVWPRAKKLASRLRSSCPFPQMSQ